MIKSYLKSLQDKYFKSLRSKYSRDLKEYLPEMPCIISNNCLAGFIYQDIGLQYSSPTIGLYFFFPDYILFLSDLEKYLYSELTFVKYSKYELGNERYSKAQHKYPIGLLDNQLEIHFLHYKSEQEAEKNWKRRLERVDLNNLVVLGTQLDLCTESDITDFDRLPFENKYFLTRSNLDLRSVQFVKEFANNPKIGDPYRNGHLLYENLIKKLKETQIAKIL